ncbi:hypothetical protein NliqN6_2502 [Naganishia liquefaciens]|uniref:DNA polymerase epsilon subunit n=1 Tax=Naganishia liquefaciens TaxID=104408 RepID=A0A8H3TSZ9_9TREE|nr:hypothetical protein NliqN6_2502 [Naganishia liquefaciens]
MANSRLRNIIIKVFSTKYSLTLPTQTLLYIENVMQEHDIGEEEWQAGLELLAKEYLRGEDPSPLVSLEALKRAYESLQLKTDFDEEPSRDYASQSHSHGLARGMGHDPLDTHVDSHFHVINSFDIPGLRFDAVRGTFVSPHHKPAIAGPPSARAAFLRERWSIIRQLVVRNENFTPPVIGGHDRGEYLKLTSTRNLLGRQGQLFLLFGMLSRNPEGKLCLEDGEGLVTLDMEDAVPGEGLFTEGCMVLIEGEYTVDETIRVLAMGHPPSEKREVARGIYGHIDFLGIGATSIKEEAKFQSIVEANEDISFVILSDLWLDHPKTLPNLRKVFAGYSQAEFRPYAFIFCGDFSTKGWTGADDIETYSAGFKALGAAILEYPLLAAHCQFIFIPGPNDPWSSTNLPRPPLPDTFTQYIRDKLPKATFTSNPARIQYFNQEIVIFREDLMGRMLRNLVSVKDEAGDMRRFLVQTILDQTHLSPLSLNVRPTLWEWDHTLRLYPMPTTLILADKHERYDLTYEGCHVFNPGSFVGNHFEWSVYHPSTGRSESSALPESY